MGNKRNHGRGWFSRDTKGKGKNMTEHRSGPPAPPKAEPVEMDPGMVAAMVDHRYGFTGVETLTKPITVCVASNGVFELRKNKIGVACKQLANFPTPIMGVTTKLQEGYLLAIPKVPFDYFRQIVAFFRDVNDAHKSEALVQIWFNHETNQHELYVPLQDISGGMVVHAGDRDKDNVDGRLTHVFDIHSHHTMGAFWSGTDDNDEKRNERLYGVIGQIDKMVPASKWRVTTAGKFIDLKLEDVIEVPDTKVEFNLTEFNYPLRDLMAAGGSDPSLKFPKGTVLDPFHDVLYPKSDWWANLITDMKDTRRVARPSHSNHHGSFDGRGGIFGFGRGGGIDRRPFLMGQRETAGRGTNTSGTDDTDWEHEIIGRMIANPETLPICNRWRELNRPRLAIKHVAEANPAGYAIFYYVNNNLQRAPWAEEKAILGSFPQAGYVRPGMVDHHDAPLWQKGN